MPPSFPLASRTLSFGEEMAEEGEGETGLCDRRGHIPPYPPKNGGAGREAARRGARGAAGSAAGAVTSPGLPVPPPPRVGGGVTEGVSSRPGGGGTAGAPGAASAPPPPPPPLLSPPPPSHRRDCPAAAAPAPAAAPRWGGTSPPRFPGVSSRGGPRSARHEAAPPPDGRSRRRRRSGRCAVRVALPPGRARPPGHRHGRARTHTHGRTRRETGLTRRSRRFLPAARPDGLPRAPARPARRAPAPPGKLTAAPRIPPRLQLSIPGGSRRRQRAPPPLEVGGGGNTRRRRVVLSAAAPLFWPGTRVSPVGAVLPRSQPPLACQAVLEESRLQSRDGGIPGFTSLSSAASHTAATRIIAGRSPSRGQWQLREHEAASLHPALGSDLPELQRDPPHAAGQASSALTSAIPTASGRGFPAFVFPLSQRLGRGRLYPVRDDT
ncbi:transcription initiation factor TFIID subunit 4-like [Onychostruthus taczanowskii]|uniref:transcription initiation factor TFIID subunit 4-like n=1 Tax=Onychostruthus taczanowskii TaxID=356909 RepID=UPI001B805711|nr:transcription initiation factor TFIID subunit 4-like [Onychostruthus taczanowskii]